MPRSQASQHSLKTTNEGIPRPRSPRGDPARAVESDARAGEFQGDRAPELTRTVLPAAGGISLGGQKVTLIHYTLNTNTLYTNTVAICYTLHTNNVTLNSRNIAAGKVRVVQ